MNNDTSVYARLRSIKLTAMADVLYAQELDPEYRNKPFMERFLELVSATEEHRNDSRKEKLVKKANLPLSASVAGIRYDVERTLDSGKIAEFATCEYIKSRHNIIVQGACGTGKTYLACALATEACDQNYHVSYFRLEDLIQRGLFLQRMERFEEFIQMILHPALLIIDEVYSRQIDDKELYIFSEIVAKRHRLGSLILISQYDYKTEWKDMAPEGILNESMMDRLINNSYSVTITSKFSMRTFERPV